MRTALIQVAYLGASALFMLGIRSLTRPDRARRGLYQTAFGMVLAIAGALANQEILDYTWIAWGVGVGLVLGYPLGMWVPMAAMSQRIALALSFSALAATLLGIAEYHTGLQAHGLSHGSAAALGIEVLLGSMTVSGTLVATGRLMEIITPRSLAYVGQEFVNGALFAFTLGLFAFFVMQPESPRVFFVMIGFAVLFGVLFVMPVRGEDLPPFIAVLNACSGFAACAAGFALTNEAVILTGAFGGASGFTLAVLMSRSMNRSAAGILLGGLGPAPSSVERRRERSRRVQPISVEDAAIELAYAPLVVIVPGYGLAASQAQQQVRELANLIEQRGGEVKYAIHPAAGRVPDHMRALIADAGIPRDKVLGLDDIDGEWRTDVAMIIGANDIVNPAARADRSSPMHGMPVLNVDRARRVIVLKRSLAPGFAGVDNDLFYDPRTRMLFGDAKASLTDLITEVKQL